MKKRLAVAVALCVTMLCACAGAQSKDEPTELFVLTSFVEYGNQANAFIVAYTNFLEESGHIISHEFAEVINEDWKMGVVEDFRAGNIPDVLYFFTGTDSNEMVLDGHFVPISEIRAQFPDFASNMKDSLLPVSPANGRQYAVPVNGFWQGLFVNTNVLAASGVEIPGADYTWEQFLIDSQAILDSGFTPVAVSLYEIPHYWFEFAVLNNGGMAGHLTVPLSSDDAAGRAWAAGLRDIKYLFQRGFLPENTLTATDDETAMMMINDQAAFMVDGSWKMSWFATHANNVEDFVVTYVPAREARIASDIIGGLSMGYFITRSAWEDPRRRQASVEFVMAMTTDEVVSSFSTLAVTALENGVTPPEDADAFVRSALDMTRGTTGVVAAVQDMLTTYQRRTLFNYIPYVVTGALTPEQAIERSLG